jgi:hypothetical protein
MPTSAPVLASPPQRTSSKPAERLTDRPATSVFNSVTPVQPKKTAPRKRV